MLPDELLKLFVKPSAELLGINGKVQSVRTLHTEHTGHTLL